MILSITLLLHLSCIISPAATYTLPDNHFINCGSNSSLRTYQRNFTGDENSGNFSLSSRDSTSAAVDKTLPAPSLYQTARIFRKSSFYELDLDQGGTYVSDGFPLVEEFLIKVAAGKLKIEFKPDEKERSFAFVNAIEVFLAPPELIQNDAPRVTRRGSDGNFNGVLDFPLRVLHRINVGGGNVTRETDTLMRYWIPDDAYLLFENTARNGTYSDQIKYGDEAAVFIAPDAVYNTAKEMNILGGGAANNFNMSWRFQVGNSVLHLVRLHFCDIVSNNTTNELFRFNLYIYGGYVVEVFPWNSIPRLAAPFFKDYVVESDDSGFMNLSVGPNSQSSVKTAFLNGVEILELLREKADRSRKRLLIVVGSCLGGLVLVVIVFGLVCFGLRKRKLKLNVNDAFDWPLGRLYAGSSHSRTTVRTSLTGSPFTDLNLGLKIPLSGILFATKQFNPKLMIGEGGFGKVYKGTLRNGAKVAIKRSEAGHGQGLEEFHTEIRLLSKIRHQHLVSLIGYCDERDEMILVYEFMEKGTLREHLYGEEVDNASACRFSWDERLRICSDAAKGLHYLHTGSSGTIIHRDIKSTNILLDEKYVAKVADFGLSRSGQLDQTHVSTEVKGSFGYLDPEYFRCLQLTQKSDVYSFGVVLLEVLCARPAVDRELRREEVNLADWGMLWQRRGELEKVVDPYLVGKINPNSLRKFGETVEKCLQECGADRPHMVDVLWDLEYCRRLQDSAVTRQPYEDTTTEVSWGLPMGVLQRLPTQSFGGDGDESSSDNYSGAVSSQLNANEVFSQLNMNGAR
ncbi:putative receptor-like protein kinase [Salvia divinorum]|uniref:Receptor-like protein kinase n=1 Tax=Salvia divinorum TaxID=28513 RepID=A0ABD1GCE7_SALDI